MTRVLVVLFVLAFTAVATAQERSGPPVDDATWATIRALAAERETLHLRARMIDVEFRAKGAELDALIAQAAAAASVDLDQCAPNPIAKAWQPRPGKGPSCLKSPPKK